MPAGEWPRTSMHKVEIRREIVERVLARRGRLHLFDSLDPTRTALLVVDMQNAFVAPGAPIEVPAARIHKMTSVAFARGFGSSAGSIVAGLVKRMGGAIDFETVETEIVFDDKGKIDRIVPVRRNDAHRLIEECMLAANVCASDFLREHDHPMLYRIHEGPTPEKLAALREFLKGFGLHLTGGSTPHASDYAKLLARVRDRPDVQLLQTVMLRSLRQAVYSPDNVGHFGLAYESYTHFTSPIRRYPDLLVHRAIKAVLAHRRYDPRNWRELGDHCSMTERRADEATRDVVSWLKCYYMRDKVGEAFEGSVSGIAAFGVFVALDGVYAEGLVHVSELGNDYFHFDAVRHQLVGERTSRRFRLGDRVRVRVARVDLDASRIDFVLA